MSKRPDLAERNRQNARHGMCDTSTYTVWDRMKSRCLREQDKDYKRYGARGISVCDRWMLFDNFLADMGVRPDGLQLDRINNDGNYSPENCRWVTPRQNTNNRRSSRFLEFKGKRQTIVEWAREMGICSKALMHRLKVGWSIEDALTKPVIKYVKKERVNEQSNVSDYEG